MQTWLTIDEFCKLTNLNLDRVNKLIQEDKLNYKDEKGIIYIEASSGATALTKSNTGVTVEDETSTALAGTDFLEKTIGTILNLHEKVISSKDETLDVLRNENKFLKEALFQMQELYDEDRKTINTLTEQLKFSQDELDSIKRKYRLMWGRAVETGNKLEEKKQEENSNKESSE